MFPQYSLEEVINFKEVMKIIHNMSLYEFAEFLERPRNDVWLIEKYELLRRDGVSGFLFMIDDKFALEVINKANSRRLQRCK
jgi:hypothetical protein